MEIIQRVFNGKVEPLDLLKLSEEVQKETSISINKIILDDRERIYNYCEDYLINTDIDGKILKDLSDIIFNKPLDK